VPEELTSFFILGWVHKELRVTMERIEVPIELHTIDRETPLPVEIERFWASRRNKQNLELLIHREA
jgi:hypothetical protein